MRTRGLQRLAAAAAVLVCAANLAWSGPQAGDTAQFQPAEIAYAADATYPPTSIASGTVVLELSVSPSGQVENVRVVRDIPSLTQEAVRSAKKWKFRPATLDGKPVATKTVVAFTFVNPTLVPNVRP
jgi:TonB family protein